MFFITPCSVQPDDADAPEVRPEVGADHRPHPGGTGSLLLACQQEGSAESTAQ